MQQISIDFLHLSWKHKTRKVCIFTPSREYHEPKEGFVMNKTNIANKKIVSIYENQIVGVAETVMLSKDWKKIMGIKAKDEVGEPFFIPLNKVYAFGEHAIVLRNMTACQKTTPKMLDFFTEGASILSIDGTSFGTLADIAWEENGKNTTLISAEGKEIKPNQMVCKDKELILISENQNKKLHHFKPKQVVFALENQNEILVRALEEQPTPTDAQPTLQEDNKIPFNPKAAVPSRIISSNDLLLGKKAITDILGLRNEILLRKGQTITEKHIQLSKQHGKLRELMLLSE